VGQVPAFQRPPPVVGGDKSEHRDSDILACGPNHRPILRHQSERTPSTYHYFHYRLRDRSECNDKREPGRDFRSDSCLLRRSCGVRLGRSSECEVSGCEKVMRNELR
jgi:hypothetical protein